MTNSQNQIILIKDLGRLYPTEKSKQKTRMGLYKCYCGNEFRTQAQHINSGHTKSCGCHKLKQMSKVGKKHTHNKSYHRLYSVWNAMIQRCTNINSKDYKNYGERGITICNEWLNIENFINDMDKTYSKGLTIDRINVNGNYCKENCRWTDRNIQANNTRTNRFITYKGKTLTLQQWARESGIKRETIAHRLNKGYDVSIALGF